jgi:hypothetical protein
MCLKRPFGLLGMNVLKDAVRIARDECVLVSDFTTGF